MFQYPYEEVGGFSKFKKQPMHFPKNILYYNIRSVLFIANLLMFFLWNVWSSQNVAWIPNMKIIQGKVFNIG